MIAQVGKHLRKWLLGMAMAVRNQAQAVVAKMESAEAKAAEGADREAAPGALKTARSGEPPAHWVRLVERHAPELLLPGPPDTAPRASSPVFETDPAGGQSAADNAQDPMSAETALDADQSATHEGPAFALKLPRLWRKHGAPPGRRPPSAPDEKRPTLDSDQSPEAAAGSPRDDAVPHTPKATPAGSAKVDRAVMSAAGAEITRRRRFLSRQSNASPVDARAPEAGTRNTQTPAGWIAPARRVGSAAGRIEKNRPVGRESQNIRPDTAARFQPPSRSGKDVGSIGGQAQDRQAGIQTAAGTPVLAAIKREAAAENGPRPNESSLGRPSLSDSEFKTSAPPIKGTGDDRRHVKEVRLINGQRRARSAADRIKVDEKRSRLPVFHWPDLPGEQRSEDDGQSDRHATWPSLPPAASAAAEPFWHPAEPHLSEAESRNRERLRRLDEEQRGLSWSALHF